MRTRTIVSLGLAALVVGAAWLLPRGEDSPSAARPTSVAPGPTPTRSPRRPAVEASPDVEPAEATTDEEKPRRATVVVNVRNAADGRPVEGAVVSFRPGWGEDAAVPGDLITDASGVARSSFETSAAKLRLRVRAPGFVVEGWFDRSFEDDALDATVDLRPAAPFDGVVLDATSDSPIAGALVTAREEKEAVPGRPPDEPLFEGPTAADGTFRVDAPKDVATRLSASAKGYARNRLVRPPDAPGRVELRLFPGAAVRGVVRDAAGAPIADFGVHAVATGEGASQWDEAKTDAEGRFELEGVAFDRAYDVWADDADYERGASNVVRGLRLTRGAPAPTLELVLQPLVNVEVVVRRADGVAATGRVDVAKSGGPIARLDDDGRARLEDVQPGRVELRVRPENAMPRVATLDVPPGGGAAHEIVVEAGLAVAGRVVDELGGAVVDARVAVTREDLAAESDSGPGGAFRVDGLPAGAAALGASAQGHETVFGVDVAAPSEDVRVVLRREGAVTLRVHAPPGVRQLRGVVQCRSLDGAPGRQMSFANCDAPCVLRQGLSPGRWVVSLDVEGMAEIEREVAVTGATERAIDVTLEEGGTLAGRVVDAQGRPVADAQLLWRTRSVGADGDGRFVFDHAAHESATLVATARGFLPTSVVTAAAEDVVVVLRRGGLLKGDVRQADGTPEDDATVAVAHPDAPPTWDRVRSNGRFELRLPAGRVRVEIRRGDDVVLTREAELRDGETTDVVFELPR